MQNLKEVQRASGYLAKKLPPSFRPRLALICGTGLGELVRLLDGAQHVAFANIPAFPRSTVVSHTGSFAAGFMGTTPLIVQQGRCHLYEGCSPAEVCMGVRVMRMLGADTLLITNAAGCLNSQWDAGDLMVLADHINYTGVSPLSGFNVDSWGPRFPDMSRIYDAGLIRLALEEAQKAGIRVERGVYAGVRGPELESPAETRFYRQAGADAVGMSTVLEAVAARHMGMRVLGLSCLTNKNLPDCMAETGIEEIVAAAEKASGNIIRLLGAVIRRL